MNLLASLFATQQLTPKKVTSQTQNKGEVLESFEKILEQTQPSPAPTNSSKVAKLLQSETEKVEKFIGRAPRTSILENSIKHQPIKNQLTSTPKKNLNQNSLNSKTIQSKKTLSSPLNSDNLTKITKPSSTIFKTDVSHENITKKEKKSIIFKSQDLSTLHKREIKNNLPQKELTSQDLKPEITLASSRNKKPLNNSLKTATKYNSAQQNIKKTDIKEAVFTDFEDNKHSISKKITKNTPLTPLLTSQKIEKDYPKQVSFKSLNSQKPLQTNLKPKTASSTFQSSQISKELTPTQDTLKQKKSSTSKIYLETNSKVSDTPPSQTSQRVQTKNIEVPHLKKSLETTLTQPSPFKTKENSSQIIPSDKNPTPSLKTADKELSLQPRNPESIILPQEDVEEVASSLNKPVEPALTSSSFKTKENSSQIIPDKNLNPSLKTTDKKLSLQPRNPKSKILPQKDIEEVVSSSNKLIEPALTQPSPFKTKENSSRIIPSNENPTSSLKIANKELSLQPRNPKPIILPQEDNVKLDTFSKDKTPPKLDNVVKKMGRAHKKPQTALSSKEFPQSPKNSPLSKKENKTISLKQSDNQKQGDNPFLFEAIYHSPQPIESVNLKTSSKKNSSKNLLQEPLVSQKKVSISKKSKLNRSNPTPLTQLPTKISYQPPLASSKQVTKKLEPLDKAPLINNSNLKTSLDDLEQALKPSLVGESSQLLKEEQPLKNDNSLKNDKLLESPSLSSPQALTHSQTELPLETPQNLEPTSPILELEALTKQTLQEIKREERSKAFEEVSQKPQKFNENKERAIPQVMSTTQSTPQIIDPLPIKEVVGRVDLKKTSSKELSKKRVSPTSHKTALKPNFLDKNVNKKLEEEIKPSLNTPQRPPSTIKPPLEEVEVVESSPSSSQNPKSDQKPSSQPTSPREPQPINLPPRNFVTLKMENANIHISHFQNGVNINLISKVPLELDPSIYEFVQEVMKDSELERYKVSLRDRSKVVTIDSRKKASKRSDLDVKV